MFSRLVWVSQYQPVGEVLRNHFKISSLNMDDVTAHLLERQVYWEVTMERVPNIHACSSHSMNILFTNTCVYRSMLVKDIPGIQIWALVIIETIVDFEQLTRSRVPKHWMH